MNPFQRGLAYQTPNSFGGNPATHSLGIGQEGPYNMSFWKHCYHIVWATKRREPLILPVIEARLYAYIAHKAGELGVFLYAMGGTEDHMHIVPAIPPKHSVAWVAKTLKGASAHFVNTGLRPPGLYFAWQRGYGSLTVGERQRADAVDYVLRQKERHQQQTTNVWLERCGVDEEDGRLNEEEEMPPTLSILCEPSTSYESAVDLPW